MAMWRWIINVVVFLLCVWTCGGLSCFNCMDSTVGGRCVHDYKVLVNVSKGIFKNGSRYFFKECPLAQNVCVIETYYVGGVLKSLIRDCSDGHTFSFTGEVTSPKLAQVTTDNFSTCIYRSSANMHICVTLCEGDFCNGPQAPNDTSCNESEPNSTCGASGLSFLGAPGPLGPLVDRLLGRGGYLLPPLMVALLSIVGVF